MKTEEILSRLQDGLSTNKDKLSFIEDAIYSFWEGGEWVLNKEKNSDSLCGIYLFLNEIREDLNGMLEILNKDEHFIQPLIEGDK